MSNSSFSLGAEYLGWKPTDGLCGRQFVQPVARDLLSRRSSQRFQLKRHVLEFDKRKLRIWEMDPRTGLRTGGRYPSVPVQDITFAQQEDGGSDPLVFSLILFGYNEESNRSVHVHAWRGNSLEEVSEFAGRMVRCLSSPQHLRGVRQLELELVRRGEARSSGYFEPLSAEPTNSGGGGGSRSSGSRPSSQLHSPHPPAPAAPPPPPPPPPLPPPPPQQSPQVVGAQVTEELKQKLRDNSGAPLLHPPRDYDTLSRSHGNVLLRRTEQPLRSDSKAPSGAYIRRSEIRDAATADDSQAAFTAVNGGNRDNVIAAAATAVAAATAAAAAAAVDEEYDPPPDYDSEGEEDDGGASTGTLDSASRLEASFISSSGRSSISDHSADPARGFSTWRRRRAQAQLRHSLPGWQQPLQADQQPRRPPSNHRS